MPVIPYLSQGQGVDIDPLTGLRKRKKATVGGGITGGRPVEAFSPLWNQGAIDASLAANPQGTFGPSPGVNYPSGGAGGVNYPSGGAGGGMPDYKALIAAALGPFQAQLAAEGVQDRTWRDDQIIRALGQFGQEFDLAGANAAFGEGFVSESGLGDLLPRVNELARQTTGAGMSYTAQASKAHKDAVRTIRNTLAARGLLRSGETGYQLQEQQTQFDTGQYDARMKLGDFLSGVNRGYTEAERARQKVSADRAREEADRQAQLNPMPEVAPPPPPPPPPDNATPWPWQNPPPTIFPPSRPARNSRGGYGYA